MTMLVTGATGFVGAAVARHLLAAGHEVRVLARPNGDRRNIRDLEVEVVEGDLTDPATLDSAVRRCKGLFHVAADYRLWTRDPAAMFRVNVDGTRNILMAAAVAGVERMVYTSSVATLGLPGDGMPGTEDTPVSFRHMIGPYKQSKFMAEEEARRLAREAGVPVVIVNPSTPVGPGDVKPTPTGRMILDAALGRMPAYVKTGLNVVHVDDVAKGHLLAYEKGVVGERYVLGGENMTLRRLLAEIAALVGRRPPWLRLPHGVAMPVAWLAEAWTRLTGGDRPFATVDGVRMARKMMFYRSDKAKAALGYEPRPASAALTDALAWFRENGYMG